MKEELRVLVVEDGPSDAQLAMAELACQWERVKTREELLDRLEAKSYDLVLADYNLSSLDGLTALKLVRERGYDIPVIITMSGAVSEETVAETLRFGATGYVVKEQLSRLVAAVRRALEGYEEQVEAERLEMRAKRSEAVGVMVGGIAHNVNNVLAAVTLWAEISLSQEDAEKRAEAIQHVIDAAADGAQAMRRIQRIIVRPDETDGVEELNVAEMAAECIEFTRPLWKEQAEVNDVYIDVVGVREDVSTQIKGDAAGLRAAIVSLIQNAVEAMPNGGVLDISTYRSDNDACLSVSDTGVGITDEQMVRIFDPLYSTKEYDGLSLSAAQRVVTAHGGHIEVQSEVGKGTSFVVRLPVVDTAGVQTEPQRLEEEAPATGNFNILVVDDELLVRDAMKAILEGYGHRVATAIDGVDAMDVFQGDTFDVVLLDLGLPKMNGYRVAEKIKGLRPDIPVFFITGWGDDIDREKIKTLGVDAVIGKPFQPDDLIFQIEAMLRDERRRTPEG